MIILSALLLFGTIVGAHANNLKRASAQVLILMQQAVQNRKAADDKLYLQMQHVAQRLEHFHRLNHHFPEAGPECDRFLAGLDGERANNPYFQDPLLKSAIADCPATTKYELRSDLGLTEFTVATRLNLILNDCHSQCGTIGILHNTENSFLVWAAGCDGRPIQDSTTGSARVIFKSF